MAVLRMSRLPLSLVFLCALVCLTIGLDQVSAGADLYGRDVFGAGDHSSRKSSNAANFFGDEQIPFLAPVYRNVSPGAAWVLPNNAFDLAFRSLECECFDPAGR